MTRTVNGEYLFDGASREVLRKQLWQVADFCGIRIITYTIVSNHFHVKILVPKKSEIVDAELIRRYKVLHPYPTRHQAARVEVIEMWLATQSVEGAAWRKRMLALMGDVSHFMQLLKQRFSIWFNKNHGRYGTLWSERFKSILMEGMIPPVAAYIDLNCIRAGLATDPKDYRFCCYAEAVAGNEKAREGLCLLLGEKDWNKAQAAYRQIIFSIGAKHREKGEGISAEDFKRVISEKGKLALGDVLRCRIRYFTGGAVLGSATFVEAQLAAYRLRTGRKMRAGPRPLPAITDWGELSTLRPIHGCGFG